VNLFPILLIRPLPHVLQARPLRERVVEKSEGNDVFVR
jgi:hypothetical protein